MWCSEHKATRLWKHTVSQGSYSMLQCRTALLCRILRQLGCSWIITLNGTCFHTRPTIHLFIYIWTGTSLTLKDNIVVAFLFLPSYFCVFVCVAATVLRYAPKWGCADSHWDPSLPAPHLDHRGYKGTSSPGVDRLYGVALDTSHILETEAWMAKAGGDLKARKKVMLSHVSIRGRHEKLNWLFLYKC